MASHYSAAPLPLERDKRVRYFIQLPSSFSSPRHRKRCHPSPLAERGLGGEENISSILLLLPQCRHGYRYIKKSCPGTYAAFATVGWCSRNISCGRFFRRPKHISQHAGGSSCIFRQDTLYIIAASILQRVVKIEECRKIIERILAKD